MSCLWTCCCSGDKKEDHDLEFYRKYQEPAKDLRVALIETPEDERKYPDQPSIREVQDIDPKTLHFVKKKLIKIQSGDDECITLLARKYISHSSLERYFSHIVAGPATEVILETTDEIESSFHNTWEKTMLQKRSIQRFEAVVNFPIKLILSDLQIALPPFASSFAKMIQLEFGPLHAALVIDDVLVEWDDTSLVIPSTDEKEWVFQTRLQSRYDKVAKAMKPELRDSARKMDLERQIEQVFEVTKEKQQAISQLIEVIIHYNKHYEYSVLTRNCQHFVIDAMKALGIDKVPQFTGVFQDYFKELKRGKSTNILEKFETHAALDEHVNRIIKPGLSQHDLEYLLCQYFMFHVSSRKLSPYGQDQEWKCEEESCRMSEIEDMLQRDNGSFLFSAFSVA